MRTNTSSSLVNFRDRIPNFFREVLSITLTEDQIKIAESVQNNRQTNCQSAHAQGKTLFAAGLLLYWVFVHRGLAISTAPTARQVKELLWGDLRRLYDAKQSTFGGYRGELFVKLDETARGFGFTAAQHAGTGSGSQAFQGIHSSAGVLVVVDEAGGVSQEIFDGVEACNTAHCDRTLLIGNPTARGTPFHVACALQHIKIPAFNHPNVRWAYQAVEIQTAQGKMPRLEHRLKPEVAQVILDDLGKVMPQKEWPPHLPRDVIPGAVSVQWIEETRTKRGEESPFWQSRVNALFPEDDTDGIILRSLLEAGRRRYDADPEYWDTLANKYWYRVGTDVADGGDNNALAYWKGPVLYSVTIHPTTGDGEDTNRAADMTMQLLKRLGPRSRAAIDNGGPGAGTFGILQRAGCSAMRCNFGNKPHDQNQFDNLKIELYWDMREGLRSGKYAIAPLGEKEDYIFADLSATRYITLKDGNLCCEPKSETKKRLKRSPDSEAAVIALKIPQELAGVPVPPSAHGREEKDLLPNRLWDNQNLAAKANEAARAFDV